MFPNLSADIQRYISDPQDRRNLYLFFEQGIWAIVVYRFGQWTHAFKISVISIILRIIAFFLFKMTEILTGISIPASAKIGKGLYVGHFGSIILHSQVVIGENCSLGPGIVIGTRGLGSKGVPIIGDHVYVGTGAKILGGIRIGNHVRVGANAVVLQDIPDHCTVVGVPGRIIKHANDCIC